MKNTSWSDIPKKTQIRLSVYFLDHTCAILANNCRVFQFLGITCHLNLSLYYFLCHAH